MLDTRLHFADGAMVTQRTQDCTAIAEHAKALHNEGFHGSSEFRHAASIPYVFLEKYCNDHNLTLHEVTSNQEHVKRILNDPALAHFRIWKGKV